VATSLTIVPFVAGAQMPGTVGNSPPSAGDIGAPPGPGIGSPPRNEAVPQLGGPLLPGTQTGLDKVAEDGVSTKTVKAVPCSTFARETDGTTTCVGIPDPEPPARRRK
jgi:hypothetical protein